MTYSLEVKTKALNLRKQGFSLKEVAEELKIAKSTTSVWLSAVVLNKKAQTRLKQRSILGQYKSQLIAKAKRERVLNELNEKAIKELKHVRFDEHLYRFFCSLLYWCEGTKINRTSLKFTNSDPAMIAAFLQLLRKSFDLNESKFRALVHIHEYHNDEKQKTFWSKITKIPLAQFNRSYRKPNTGKRIRKNYQGCVSIVYYDAKIAKELKALYNTLGKYLGV